jgi:nitrate/nitrite-specific signal transduction histidine kinase
MFDINADAFEATQDSLMETYLLLFKVSNRADSKSDILKIKKQRKKVNRELDRMEMAIINTLVLPEQIQQAIDELGLLTKEVLKEKERIKKITKKLKKVDEYINQAKKVLEISSKLFVLV